VYVAAGVKNDLLYQEFAMKKCLWRFASVLCLVSVLVACSAPPITGEPGSASVNEMATNVAMTLQALAPGSTQRAEPTATPTSVPEQPANLLPHSLYILAPDSQAISQIYRLEVDGRKKLQLTAEPANVEDYDVSPADGRLAFQVNNQLMLLAADGSDRRIVAEFAPDAQASFHPTFSPDGQTLAYAQNGLNLYSVAAGTSSLVIQDQMEDVGNGVLLPIETYSPERYSPDGTRLLVALGHWEVAPSHAIYDPATNGLVRQEDVQEYRFCCSFHGGPAWSPDGSSFYGVASAHDFAYQSGELWRVDATSGKVTRSLAAINGMLNLPKELYPAPDGDLYFFLGTYSQASGYFDAPVLQMVRSAPDGVTDRAVLRNENFVLMREALWAPDASFVIVASAPDRSWNQAGGVLELYPTDGQKVPVWLAPLGSQLKWGP
jgi:Tol biopolymer transport system component